MSTARQTEEHVERNRVVGEECKRKDTAKREGRHGQASWRWAPFDSPWSPKVGLQPR